MSCGRYEVGLQSITDVKSHDILLEDVTVWKRLIVLSITAIVLLYLIELWSGSSSSGPAPADKHHELPGERALLVK